MEHVNKLVEKGKAGVGSFQEGYEQLVQAIIRPPRSSYNSKMLGPKRFMFAGRIYHRQDFDICSHRPDRSMLKCSHFKPEPKDGEMPLRRPCVIFLHGNAASRMEGLCIIKTVLAASADLFLFDFGGSGLSEGEYVSLGHFEKEDLEAVVNRLRHSDHVSSIGLWGRSMGAVTALLYAVRDPSIAGMVVDSPFTDLRTLAGELCEKETYGAVPSWLADAALSVIRVSIQQRVGFDLDELCPISIASQINIPAIFAAADEDDFIYPHHARMIEEEYCGQSRFMNFEGDHNSDRPKEFFADVRRFFMRTLHGERHDDIWSDKERTRSDVSAARQESEAESEEKRKVKEQKERAAADSMKLHKDQLMMSPFGAENVPISAPEPEPSEAEKQAEASRRAAAAARRERAAEDAARRAREESLSPQRRAPRSPAGTGNGREIFAPQQAAAPSLEKGDIKKQLLGLGFSASQVEKAMVRNSTLEGCVEWVLTSS